MATLQYNLFPPPSVSHAHSSVKAIQKLNETELRLGLDSKTSPVMMSTKTVPTYVGTVFVLVFVGESKYMSANGSVLGTLYVNLAVNSNMASSM